MEKLLETLGVNINPVYKEYEHNIQKKYEYEKLLKHAHSSKNVKKYTEKYNKYDQLAQLDLSEQFLLITLSHISE